jgi:diguanylate cyclase (GGDEF)-like protein
MPASIPQILTESIDEIVRKWVGDLRGNSRTEVHKQLLSADIVDGVKVMLANLAQAIEGQEVPNDEPLPVPITTGVLTDAALPETAKRVKAPQPMEGSLARALAAASSLGRLRHRQAYEIQEVLYEYVKLRQRIWAILRSAGISGDSLPFEDVAYVDRLLDELMLTTVESFYTTSLRDLEKRAIHDPLTQLYNKDYFHQRLNDELRRAVRYAEPISVAILDMDHLKTINDTFGHPAGDEAIKAISAAIKDTVRQSDVPCRYGGDEFIVILPETSKAQACAFANRVIRAVRNLSLVLVPGHQTTWEGGNSTLQEIRESLATGKLDDHSAITAPAPTISIGIAAFPEDARNPETLLAKADAALYRAKNEGRNRIAC